MAHTVMETFAYRGQDADGTAVVGKVRGPHRRAVRAYLRDLGFQVDTLKPARRADGDVLVVGTDPTVLLRADDVAGDTSDDTHGPAPVTGGTQADDEQAFWGRDHQQDWGELPELGEGGGDTAIIGELPAGDVLGSDPLIGEDGGGATEERGGAGVADVDIDALLPEVDIKVSPGAIGSEPADIDLPIAEPGEQTLGGVGEFDVLGRDSDEADRQAAGTETGRRRRRRARRPWTRRRRTGADHNRAEEAQAGDLQGGEPEVELPDGDVVVSAGDRETPADLPGDGGAVDGFAGAGSRVDIEIPVAVPKAKTPFWKLETSTTKIKRVELMALSRQLAAFVGAGVPLTQGLATIVDDSSPALAAVLRQVLSDVSAGMSFADAMDRHPGTFPAFYLGTLHAAELTGELAEILERLADYIDRDITVRRKVVSALMYPAIVLAMAAVSLTILVLFVLPRFQALFETLDVPLPTLTKIMLSGSQLVSQFWLIGIGAAVTGIGLAYLYLRTPRGRRRMQMAALRIPLVRGVVRCSLYERFLRVFSTTVEAGVPMLRALDTVADSMQHPLYTQRLAEVRNAIMEGEGIADPIERSGLLPAAACQMVRVGEETGTLGHQLARAAVYYDEELDYRLRKLTTSLEPIVILVIGLIVGFVALTMVTTMYGVYQSNSGVS